MTPMGVFSRLISKWTANQSALCCLFLSSLAFRRLSLAPVKSSSSSQKAVCKRPFSVNSKKISTFANRPVPDFLFTLVCIATQHNLNSGEQQCLDGKRQRLPLLEKSSKDKIDGAIIMRTISYFCLPSSCFILFQLKSANLADRYCPVLLNKIALN